MPERRTKRGRERTPLAGEYDVLICGASFAGLAVARELRGARVLIVDRYEVGERQTSACAAPTEWIRALGLEESVKQTFDRLVVHTPHGTSAWPLPFTFSTFDYPRLCELLDDQNEAEFETAKVNGRTNLRPDGAVLHQDEGLEAPRGNVVVHTDRGDLTAPLIVDALGWRRVLGTDDNYQPPEAPLSRGLEVHPHGSGGDLELWIDRSYVPAGYGWSFPADDELRIGVGSFDPRYHVKEPTVRLATELGEDAVRYQGNWIPHKIRSAVDDEIFFAGDSAGHCIPLTAEGIRTAWHFGIACGRELQAVVDGGTTREQALARYGAFSDRHRRKFDWMLRAQRAVPRIPPRLLRGVVAAMGRPALSHWAFGHYLGIASAPSDRLVAGPDRVPDHVHNEVNGSNGHEPQQERVERHRPDGQQRDRDGGDEVRLVVHD
jgi:flavin-dependent dehydrogenase